MCHHYGKLSDQFFEQRDRIEELKEELTDARAEIIRMQSETRREIEERIAQHVQNGAIHGDGGEIIGWRTCDCHACTSIGRSPRGPDFRYDDAWEKRGSL